MKNDQPQGGGHIYRAAAIFLDKVDNIPQSEQGQQSEYEEPELPMMGRIDSKSHSRSH